MTKKTVCKFGFLGAGQMGEAILSGIIREKLAASGEIMIFDAYAPRMAEMKKKHKVHVAKNAAEVVLSCGTVVLAVKPQDLGVLLESIPADIAKTPLFISIAAGKSLKWLEAELPLSRVIRVMPNLAMRVAEGMSAFCLGSKAKASDAKTVAAVLSCSGEVVRMEEKHFDAVTALSGSGPAFFAVVLKAFVEGAVKLGISPDDALLLAKQTMLGTSKVLKNGTESLDDFVKAVTSKKGTTEAGLKVLVPSSIGSIAARTLKAAAKRSAELGKC